MKRATHVRFGGQVCLKLAGPLRAAIEEDAAARERSISWVIRRILVDHYAPAPAQRPSASPQPHQPTTN